MQTCCQPKFVLSKVGPLNGRNIYYSRLMVDGHIECVDVDVDIGEYQAPRAFTASSFRSLMPHAVSGVEKQYSTLPW
jgi:hypothetical protein